MHAAGGSLSVQGKSPRQSLEIDTTRAGGGRMSRGGRGVLSKGSPAATLATASSPAHSGNLSDNPWQVVLSPRKQKPDAHVTKGQSKTTATRAKRVRREKALAKIAAEEAEAARKGGIAYARRMKQEKAEKARAKAKADRLAKKFAKVKGNAGKSKNHKSDTTANRGVDTTANSRSSVKGSASLSGSKGASDNNAKTTHVRGTKTAKKGSSATRHRNSSTSSSRLSSHRARSRVADNASSKQKNRALPSRTKLRQLKEEADTQESIRALIDKVTIDFERMPSGESMVTTGGSERTKETGQLDDGAMPPAAPSATVMPGLHRPDESVDLESARLDIQIGHQAVGREEEELARRAAALEEDMARLKQRKLKLHLAKYEHDLRLQAKKRLASMESQSQQQMEAKMKTLSEHTKRQLDALDEFDRDLRKKIQRLLTLQAQTEEKRCMLNDAFENGQASLQAAHREEVNRMKELLEKQVQGRLNDAAKAEGWKLHQNKSGITADTKVNNV